MKILAVDAGVANIGYAVMENELQEDWRPLEIGLIRTEADPRKKRIRAADDDMQRVAAATRELSQVIGNFNIKRMCAELPPGGAKSAAALKFLCYAGAILAATAEHFNLFVEYYSPGEVRKCITGKWTASKEPQTEAMIKMYPQLMELFTTKQEREHPADALAVFETARKIGNITRI